MALQTRMSVTESPTMQQASGATLEDFEGAVDGVGVRLHEVGPPGCAGDDGVHVLV